MAAIDKIIVINSSALRRKYGSGFSRVTAALKRLIAADKARGLRSMIVALDRPIVMKRLGAKAVTDASGPAAYKAAIDSAYRALSPDYLLLLGAPDVIPHQDLANPLYLPNGGDSDQIAWSDLPYACEAPYSKRVADFRAPTRVVGRLPDLMGGSDPGYLEQVLDTAATYKPLPRTNYDAYLGITAEVWKNSTALSLRNTFGNDTALQSVPPKDSRWPVALLRARSHFINCHGGQADPNFYGQRGGSYPIAHAAAYVANRLSRGTIASAECCYGSELYDPALSGGQAGLCNTYLGAGAYGFFGSSTIAYGPSAGNGQADILCQLFLQRVRLGSSLGRATLEARQRYIQGAGTLDPTDLKTIAQFGLMGDPALHAVIVDQPALTQTKVYKQAFKDEDPDRASRGLRRRQLAKAGIAIAQTVGAARTAKGAKPGAKVRGVLERTARASGVRGGMLASFAVDDPAQAALRGAKIARPGSTGFHVLVGEQASPRGAKAKRGESPSLPRVVVLVAAVQDGQVVSLRRLHSR
jgi:Peptidase family C25